MQQEEVLDDETISHNYDNIEQRTRAFLETPQEQEGPPIDTLSPKDAHAVLSNLQAALVAKLPADIETVPSWEVQNG
jgi:hypothetical protein